MAEVTHSKNFEKYKGHYDAGFWNIEMLKNVIRKRKLTEEEFSEITGEEYTD